MRYLLAIASLIGVFFFPQVYEEANGPCQALEKKILRIYSDSTFAGSIIGGIGLALTDGEMGQAHAENKYPRLPKPLNCVIAYYVPQIE